jgi:hypothetical protein
LEDVGRGLHIITSYIDFGVPVHADTDTGFVDDIDASDGPNSGMDEGGIYSGNVVPGT